MDVDLRKPRLHKVFDVKREGGLKEVLEAEKSFQEAVYSPLPELGFDLLAACAPSDHPTEILGSEKMQALMEEIKKKYDIVIMDSPPYLAVADVAVLTEYTSAILIAARYQKTDRRHLRDAKRRFHPSESKVMGVVINRVSVREKDYYYHQYYYYGYGDNPSKR